MISTLLSELKKGDDILLLTREAPNETKQKGIIVKMM